MLSYLRSSGARSLGTTPSLGVAGGKCITRRLAQEGSSAGLFPYLPEHLNRLANYLPPHHCGGAAIFYG